MTKQLTLSFIEEKKDNNMSISEYRREYKMLIRKKDKLRDIIKEKEKLYTKYSPDAWLEIENLKAKLSYFYAKLTNLEEAVKWKKEENK